jgi:hypothetical protein
MSNTLTVKNWAKFQHYRDRCPPWIKLHSDTFQNPDFARLPIASKLLAICIWTLASRSSDGTVPDDLEYIRQWGFLGAETTQTHLDDLINGGWLQRASKSLAKRRQMARPEERRGRGETQVLTETERETEGSTEPNDPCAIALPLNDHSCFPVTQKQVEDWEPTFPAVDVLQQLRNMRAWLDANPDRKKTRRGTPAFIVRWLTKEQDKGKGNGNRQPQKHWRTALNDEAAKEAIRDIRAEFEASGRDHPKGQGDR